MKTIAVGSSRNACWPAVPARRGRRIHATKAYAPSTVEGVRCIAPNSSLVDSEQGIKTLGQVIPNTAIVQQTQLHDMHTYLSYKTQQTISYSSSSRYLKVASHLS